MNVRKSFGIIFVILFTSPLFLIHTSGNMKYTSFIAQQNETFTPYEEITFITKAAPGFENIKSNVIRDGEFEEVGSDNDPVYFNYGGDAYEISNASYQDDVHGGSYAMYYSAEGTDQLSTTTYTGRSLTSTLPYVYLDDDLALDMWFKIKANPNLAQGAYANMYVQFYDGSQNYYLYYYFSRQAALPSNSTYYAYYDVRQPVGSWFNLQRNLTKDFEEALTTITITPSFYATYIQFRCSSIEDPAGPTEMVVDDIYITNSTGYNILQENGDFEDGNSYRWYDFRTGPASIRISDEDYTQGSHSMNLTAQAYYDDSSCYLYCQRDFVTDFDLYPNSFYPTEPGAFVLAYDWKYSDTSNGGFYQNAFQYMYLQNETFSAYLYFLLGEASDTMPSSNYTSSTYMFKYYTAPSFGSRDTWEHFNLDLFDLYQLENFGNLIPTSIGYQLNAGYEQNSTTTLLVDDLRIVANPLGDPSFELDTKWHPNDPLYSWTAPDHNYVNRTTFAHTGNYAANVTMSNPGSAEFYRRAYLPIEENLFLDFWWFLDDLSGPSYAYSYIWLELDSLYDFYYIIGKTSVTTFTNESDLVFCVIEELNQTGSWNNLFRNVQNDIFDAFGEANWNITRVSCGILTSGTSSISAFFDDLYFVRDVAAPEISNLVQTPLYPQYIDSVTIEVDIIDNVGIASAEMFYRIDSGSWFQVGISNVVGNHYATSIPNYGYNSIIQYFIEASDVYGHESSLGSDTSPLEYTVIDLIDPYLVVEAPPTDEPINDIVIFNITGLDVGSGTASFEITIDTEVVFFDTIVPTDYTWETTYLDNGNHTIIFTLEDNAGNIATLQLEYIVEHHVPWYVRAKTFLQKWYPYITAGAGVLIIGSFTLAIVIRVRKRRKAT